MSLEQRLDSSPEPWRKQTIDDEVDRAVQHKKHGRERAKVEHVPETETIMFNII